MYDPRKEIVIKSEDFNLDELKNAPATNCQGCGKCCENMECVSLNPRDVFNIARALNLTCEQVLEKYCTAEIDCSHLMVKIKLKSEGAKKTCPFLVGKHCSIHSQKPTACSLFPLIHHMVEYNPSMDISLIPYGLTAGVCYSHSKKRTPDDWLKNSILIIEDDFIKRWNEVLNTLSWSLHEVLASGTISERAFLQLCHDVLLILCAFYDLQTSFYQQFEKNVLEVQNAFESSGF
jgi:Fe-S-cluster containining protein